MTDNITINDAASFRESIGHLTELNSSLAEKLKTGGQAVIDAVTAEASKGVVYPANGPAAAYAGTIAALTTAVENIKTQATEASNAVAGQVRDLTSLVDGLTNIDDSGAAGVAATS
jgi:hypothetical protein